ncbi:WRKY DNA-binding protein 32, partial [Trifolium medium]|nr:WRKY DNA-binding protein 32 [Trifolium medium]
PELQPFDANGTSENIIEQPLMQETFSRVERVEKARYVGISGDGYRWHKVGGKIVKGNPHP